VCFLGVAGRVLEREHLFRGSALNAMDAKGRLSVPSFIRQKIERRSDEKVLVLGLHDSLPCIVGYDTNYSGELWAESERKRLAEEERDPFAHLAREIGSFGSAMDVPYDPSGRIIMPGRLKKRAEIDELAMFVGMGGTFIIWNPHKALESGVPQLRDLAADLLEERGVA